MKTFDPWTATLDEAEAADAGADSMRGPLAQWAVAQGLHADQQNIVSSGPLVLAAVAECALYGLVMPPWLADAYLGRFRTVSTHQAKSWDAPEAFGEPFPKGKQLAAANKKRRLLLPVLVTVERRIAAGEAIDKKLFEVVGARFNVGTTLAEEFYYEAKRLYRSR